MKVNGVIVAAGMSRRMGEFKPLLMIHNKTMIEQSIDSMLASGVKQITLVLGYRAEEIEKVLKSAGYTNKQVNIVYNREYENTEMIDSIKIGVKNLKKCDAFYLLPGDMPAISVSTFLKVRKSMEENKCRIVFPTIEGYRKHPPLISYQCVEEILCFSQEGGLRELWRTMESDILTVPVDDKGCSMDVDTKPQYHLVCEYMF